MLHELTSADFTPFLHQTFQLQRSTDLPVTVELISVPTGGVPKPTDRGPFSVVFRGSAWTYLPQSQYTLAHPQLGLVSFWLAPIGLDESGIHYEATFYYEAKFH